MQLNALQISYNKKAKNATQINGKQLATEYTILENFSFVGLSIGGAEMLFQRFPSLKIICLLAASTRFCGNAFTQFATVQQM